MEALGRALVLALACIAWGSTGVDSTTTTNGGPHFPRSVLISAENGTQIVEWISESNGAPSMDGGAWTRCYQKSADNVGTEAEDFHANCDNKGPTVTVLRLSNGNVIGGYAGVSWSSPSSSKVGCSRKTCGELGLTPPERFPNTCVTSFGPEFPSGTQEEQCFGGGAGESGAVTWARTQGWCEEIGARMCTKGELEASKNPRNIFVGHGLSVLHSHTAMAGCSLLHSAPRYL